VNQGRWTRANGRRLFAGFNEGTVAPAHPEGVGGILLEGSQRAGGGPKAKEEKYVWMAVKGRNRLQSIVAVLTSSTKDPTHVAGSRPP